MEESVKFASFSRKMNTRKRITVSQHKLTKIRRLKYEYGIANK